LRKLSEWTAVFLIGGSLYSMLEILWRGYTHWSMTITGALCFMTLYALHVYAVGIPFFWRCLLGALGITVLEFTAGCIVNLLLGWKVWDYSSLPFNLLGQICPLFSFFWFFLCICACPVCRRLAACFAHGKSGTPSCISGDSAV